MNNILVSGGCGFIGSNFISLVLDHTRNIRIINADILSYAADTTNLLPYATDSRYVFAHADIRNPAAMQQLFAAYHIDTVINFAAESHVDRSINDAGIFVSTNIGGTQTLLDTARQAWCGSDGSFAGGVKFIQISTDEVYGALGAQGSFRETDSLAPRNPYAATKAAADLLVLAYHQTYGMPINISRSANNYGPRQYPEKLIPRIILRALHDLPLPLYGDGRNIREWLFVEDNCRAILRIAEQGENGQIYNIGSGIEKNNREIMEEVLNMLNKPHALIQSVADRPGHDFRYSLDTDKLHQQLNWQPQTDFNQGIAKTIRWYKANCKRLPVI